MAGEDKTEQATPQRLREARTRGDVPTSPELTGAALGLIGLVAIQQQAGHIVTGLLNLLTADLQAAGHPGNLGQATLGAQLRSDTINGLLLLAPLAAAMLVGAAVIGALNTRGLLSIHSITPSFRKLNPATGLKNLFGKESLILTIKVLAKLVATLAILRSWQQSWASALPALPFMTPADAAGSLWGDATRIGMQICGAFLVIGAADFGYRQFAWRRRLRMSKQDVKEEYKRSEGNPHVRARMRQLGRKRLRALMNGGGLRQVPRADVVITNPTHFAIAIQYTAGKMRAPKVIAKGQRLIALRIKEAARRHNIPIVENKPLAQALFKAVEINQEIPGDLYQAVAQILAFVYRLRNPARPARRVTRRAMPNRARRNYSS